MNSSKKLNPIINQMIEKNNDELREGKKIPLAEELEKKNSDKKNNQKEQSEIITLISKQEKTEPKIVNSEKVILFPSVIEFSFKENSDDPLDQKEKSIPVVQNEISDTKSEISNSFLNKKTKNVKSQKVVNKKKNVNNNNLKDKNSTHYEKDPKEDNYFNYFYEGEEVEDEYFESENKADNLEVLIADKINTDDYKYFDFDKKNFIMKDDEDVDDKFHHEKFNKGFLCNQNSFNNEINKDMEKIGESINITTYIQAPSEENSSTYYSSKALDNIT